MSFSDRDNYDFTAPAFNFSRTNDRLGFVVAAFHDHTRPKCIHEIERCVFVKKNYQVYALETGNKVRAIALSAHRAARTLEPFYRRIGIDPDNQCVTACASRRE